eukprot:s1464_g9.t1
MITMAIYGISHFCPAPDSGKLTTSGSASAAQRPCQDSVGRAMLSIVPAPDRGRCKETIRPICKIQPNYFQSEQCWRLTQIRCAGCSGKKFNMKSWHEPALGSGGSHFRIAAWLAGVPQAIWPHLAMEPPQC